MYVAMASPLLTVGAAWGGVKVGLNGTKAAVKRIEQKLDSIDEQTTQNRIDIVRVQSRCALYHD